MRLTDDIRHILKQKLRDLTLSDKEKKMMEYRHGLDSKNDKTHTLDETGKVFGVTRERVRQVEDKVIHLIAE